MEWLSSHFFRLRVLSTDTATFGLYPKWKLYVPCITSFLQYLATQAIKVSPGEEEKGKKKGIEK